MKLIFRITLTLFAAAAMSCSKSPNPDGMGMYAKNETAKEAVFDMKPSASGESGNLQMSDVATQAADYERKITKTGDIRFQTADIAKTKQYIQREIGGLKGYIESDNTSAVDRRKENGLKIRVPSVNFDKLMNAIARQAGKVDHQNVELADVTEEYIDLDKRLKTKKELESRYIQLLQKAVKVEEILKIEEQIGNLRADIESTEGRLKYLNNQVDFSTLNVTFYEKNPEYNFWNRIVNGFSGGWNILLSFFVVLANLWAIILFATLLFFLIRYFRRKRKEKKP